MTVAAGRSSGRVFLRRRAGAGPQPRRTARVKSAADVATRRPAKDAETCRCCAGRAGLHLRPCRCHWPRLLTCRRRRQPTPPSCCSARLAKVLPAARRRLPPAAVKPSPPGWCVSKAAALRLCSCLITRGDTGGGVEERGAEKARERGVRRCVALQESRPCHTPQLPRRQSGSPADERSRRVYTQESTLRVRSIYTRLR